MCDELAAQNALLKSQLAAVARALRCERTSHQAEVMALRQKVRAFSPYWNPILQTMRRLHLTFRQCGWAACPGPEPWHLLVSTMRTPGQPCTST